VEWLPLLIFIEGSSAVVFSVTSIGEVTADFAIDMFTGRPGNGFQRVQLEDCHPIGLTGYAEAEFIELVCIEAGCDNATSPKKPGRKPVEQDVGQELVDFVKAYVSVQLTRSFRQSNPSPSAGGNRDNLGLGGMVWLGCRSPRGQPNIKNTNKGDDNGDRNGQTNRDTYNGRICVSPLTHM
jgi:hypothetical protein